MHVQAFSSGEPADFVPYLLDLSTFEWRAGPQPTSLLNTAQELAGSDQAVTADAPAPFAPTPRMRFAAEQVGRFLVVYSGHGDFPIPKV